MRFSVMLRLYPFVNAFFIALAGIFFSGKISLQHSIPLPSALQIGSLALLIFVAYAWNQLLSVRFPLVVISFAITQVLFTPSSGILLMGIGLCFWVYSGISFRAYRIKAMRTNAFLKPSLILLCWMALLYGVKLTEGQLPLSKLNWVCFFSDALLVVALSFLSDFQDRIEDRKQNCKTLMNLLSGYNSRNVILGLLTIRLFFFSNTDIWWLEIFTLIVAFIFFLVPNHLQLRRYLFMDVLLILEALPFYW
jgi:hypothetical protein